MEPLKTAAGPHRLSLVKKAVPNSTISVMIGHGGNHLKRLTAATDCRLSFSERVSQMNERILTAEGSAPELFQALQFISRKLQEDSQCAVRFACPLSCFVLLLWVCPVREARVLHAGA